MWSTIDFRETSEKSDAEIMASKGCRPCGCPYGRSCDCGCNPEDVFAVPDVCNECESCLANIRSLKKNGRPGKRKCLHPPTVESQFEEVTIGGRTFKVKKQDPEDVAAALAEAVAAEAVVKEGEDAESRYSTARRRKSVAAASAAAARLLAESEAPSTLREEFRILRLERRAVFARSAELISLLASDEQELDRVRTELMTLDERCHRVGGNETGLLYVDTAVAHGSWQRVPYDRAQTLLGERIADLAARVKTMKGELETITDVTMRKAVVHLQRVFRGYRGRSKFWRQWQLRLQRQREAAALEAQRAWRGLRGRLRAGEFRKAKAIRCAALVQRVVRGHWGRARWAKEHARQLMIKRHRATIKLQGITRMRRATLMRRSLADAKRLAEDMTAKNEAATQINRFARGFIARRTRRARRVELTLGPRVRELCEKFIAKGDLFEFLEAVNRDYELHMAQQAELRMLEVENATTFIREVLAHREAAAERAWSTWQHAKDEGGVGEGEVDNKRFLRSPSRSSSPILLGSSRRRSRSPSSLHQYGSLGGSDDLIATDSVLARGGGGYGGRPVGVRPEDDFTRSFLHPPSRAAARSPPGLHTRHAIRAMGSRSSLRSIDSARASLRSGSNLNQRAVSAASPPGTAVASVASVRSQQSFFDSSVQTPAATQSYSTAGRGRSRKKRRQVDVRTKAAYLGRLPGESSKHAAAAAEATQARLSKGGVRAAARTLVRLARPKYRLLPREDRDPDHSVTDEEQRLANAEYEYRQARRAYQFQQRERAALEMAAAAELGDGRHPPELSSETLAVPSLLLSPSSSQFYPQSADTMTASPLADVELARRLQTDDVVVLPSASSLDVDPLLVKLSASDVTEGRDTSVASLLMSVPSGSSAGIAQAVSQLGSRDSFDLVHGHDKMVRTPAHIVGHSRFAGAQSIAREIPSLDEPIDRLLLHAVLRTYVPVHLISPGGRSTSRTTAELEALHGEAAYEHFLLSAPSLVKVKHEQEAFELAQPYVASLKTRGYTTCRALLSCPLEQFGVPSDVAKQVRRLLRMLGGSLDNVRPQSVQQQWRDVVESNRPAHRTFSREFEVEKGETRRTVLAPLPAHSGAEFKRGRQLTSGSVGAGMLEPVPYSVSSSSPAARATTAGVQHVVRDRSVASERMGVEDNEWTWAASMINHFPLSQPDSRPSTAQTLAYDATGSRPGTRGALGSSATSLARPALASRGSMGSAASGVNETVAVPQNAASDLQLLSMRGTPVAAEGTLSNADTRLIDQRHQEGLNEVNSDVGEKLTSVFHAETVSQVDAPELGLHPVEENRMLCSELPQRPNTAADNASIDTTKPIGALQWKWGQGIAVASDGDGRPSIRPKTVSGGGERLIYGNPQESKRRPGSRSSVRFDFGNLPPTRKNNAEGTSSSNAMGGSEALRPASRASASSRASTVATFDWNNNAAEEEAEESEELDRQAEIKAAEEFAEAEALAGGRFVNDVNSGSDAQDAANTSSCAEEGTSVSRPTTAQHFVAKMKQRTTVGTEAGYGARQESNVVKMNDPIDSIVVHTFLEHWIPPRTIGSADDGVGGVSYDSLLARLAELPLEADTVRREILRERLQFVQAAARPHIVTLRQAGFNTVASLAACPLTSVGLPPQVADLLRTAFDRVRGEPLLRGEVHTSESGDVVDAPSDSEEAEYRRVSTSGAMMDLHIDGARVEFDRRYQLRPDDIRSPGHAPLPPVRLKMRRSRPTVGVAAPPEYDALYRRAQRAARLQHKRGKGLRRIDLRKERGGLRPDLSKGLTKQQQLVQRVLARGEEFSKGTVLHVDAGSGEHSMSYKDYKTTSQLGRDIVVATTRQRLEAEIVCAAKGGRAGHEIMR